MPRDVSHVSTDEQFREQYDRYHEPCAPSPAAGAPGGTPADAPADFSDLPAFLPPEARTAETRALLAELTANARAVAALKRHIDPAGLTRPPRHPDERAWLAARGRLGPFIERDAPYVERVSRRPETPGDGA